jgi:hypothetical protein
LLKVSKSNRFEGYLKLIQLKKSPYDGAILYNNFHIKSFIIILKVRELKEDYND